MQAELVLDAKAALGEGPVWARANSDCIGWTSRQGVCTLSLRARALTVCMNSVKWSAPWFREGEVV